MDDIDEIEEMSEADFSDDMNALDIVEDMPDDIPEDIPEDEPEMIEEDDLSDDIPEDIPEDEPEAIEENDLSDDIPEDIPEDEPEVVEEDDLSDDIPEDVPEDEPEAVEEDDLSEDIPEDVPEDEPEVVEEDDLSDDIPEDVPEDEPEAVEEDDLSEDIPEDVPEDEPEAVEENDLSEDVPEDVSEDQVETDDTATEDATEDATSDVDSTDSAEPTDDTQEEPVDDTVTEDAADNTASDVDSTDSAEPTDETQDEPTDDSATEDVTEDATSDVDSTDSVEPTEDTQEEPVDDTVTEDDAEDTAYDVDGDNVGEQTDTQNETVVDEANEFNDGTQVDPSKVLKRDELDLLKSGNCAINQRLEAQADDYRDKGMSEDEIRNRLVADKRNFQKEFLEDAFPGQDVSPDVFKGLEEDGLETQFDEIKNEDALSDSTTKIETSNSSNEFYQAETGDLSYSENTYVRETNDDLTFDDAVTSTYDEDVFELEDSDNIKESDIIKDLVDQNVSKLALPRNNGKWGDETRVGNGDFVIDDDADVSWKKNGQSHSCSGKQLKDWMEEKYNVSSVTYIHKEPDFSPFEDANIGAIELDHMSTNRTGKNGTFAKAEEIAAHKMGVTVDELRAYMSDNELTWHECADRKTVRAIPTRINAAFKHTGGIGTQKSLKAMASTLSEQLEGRNFSLVKKDMKGHVYNLNNAINQQKANFRETKRELFGKKGEK